MNIIYFTIGGITASNKENIASKLAKIPGAKSLAEGKEIGFSLLPVFPLNDSADGITKAVTSAINGTGAYVFQINIS